MKVLEVEEIISFLEQVAKLAGLESLIVVNYKTTLTSLFDLRTRYENFKMQIERLNQEYKVI